MKRTQVPDERALDDLFEKYRLAPNSYVFVPLADACRKIGRLDEALEICNRGVERHPGYASGHIVKGKCLYDRGDFDRARDTFEGVLDLDDNNLVALMFLGMIDAGAGRLDSARGYFQKILAIDPDNQEIKLTLREVEERGQDQRGDDRDIDQPSSRDDVSGPDGRGDDDTMQDGYGDVVLEAGDTEDLMPADKDETTAPETDRSPDGETPDVIRPTRDEADSDADLSEGSDEELVVSDEPIESSAELASITLADIFASQGYVSKAARIYGEVLKKEPGNNAVRRKLAELTGDSVDAPVGEGEKDDSAAALDRGPREDLEYEIISSASAEQNAVVDGDAGAAPASDTGRPIDTVDDEQDGIRDAAGVNARGAEEDERGSGERADATDTRSDRDAGEANDSSGIAPHNAGSTRGRKPDEPEKENRPEIDDTDSISHFRQWLRQMQK